MTPCAFTVLGPLGALIVMKLAQITAGAEFQCFTLYTAVGALYFVVSFPAVRLVGYLERFTRREYRQRAV